MVGSTFIRLVALLQLIWITADAQYTWDDVTPLDEYVQGDDGFWSYQYLAQYEYDGVTLYIVNMTSQKYQDESLVSRSVWWHIMGVAIPHNIRFPDAGFLFIDGGSNGNTDIPPRENIENIAVVLLANDTGTCGAYIKHVPNQPIVFSNDPTQRQRSEDSIIAWTWRTFIDAAPASDPTVILRMPMTKAAKRGLDTVAAVAKEKAPETDINRFVVAGASKRGWTTWSLACTDRRVVAMIPLVFSMLDVEKTIMNHFKNMNGAYSFAFSPYWNEGLTRDFYTPATDGVWDVEDMYRYRTRLNGVFKLEMLSSGDEFFLCDDSLEWWNQMPEPKLMMMLPNAEHSMAPHYIRIYETAASFWLTVLEKLPLPRVTWTMQETALGGFIVFNTNPPPENVTVFSATTLEDGRRDFRLADLDENGDVRLHPVAWRQNVSVVDFGNGESWGAQVEQVPGKWIGFFFQGIWKGPEPDNYRMYLTSQVNVVPYTWPRGPCLDNDDCYGYLV